MNDAIYKILFEIAAKNVRYEHLSDLYDLCDKQGLVRTYKLRGYLDNIREEMRKDGIRLRGVIEQLVADKKTAG